MGAIKYAMKDGQYVLADDCHVTPEDGVEKLDCTVYLFNLLRKNGFYKIDQVIEQPGMTFFNLNCMSMKYLRELFTRLDFLGFRLADWKNNQSVDDYYATFIEPYRKWQEEEMARCIEADLADRRERARIRAKERRARLKTQKATDKAATT